MRIKTILGLLCTLFLIIFFNSCKTPETTDTKQIVVTEYFAYACPDCNAFEPRFETWIKAQESDVVIAYVPVSLGYASWLPYVRLSCTLQKTGDEVRLRPLVYVARHQQGLDLSDVNVVRAWFVSQGGSSASFDQYYNSADVDACMSDARAKEVAHGITGTPTLYVNDKKFNYSEFRTDMTAIDNYIASLR